MTMLNSVSLLRLGRMSYAQALTLQERVVSRIKRSQQLDGQEAGQSCLILVEHLPVYTVGMRSKVYSKEEEDRLLGLGAQFHRTNRGGLITFHGPGQMVAYPILNLRQFVPEEKRRKSLLGMKWYVWNLEQMIIDMLASVWGVKGFRSPHTGVWVTTPGPYGCSKICAVGVHNSDLVTSHGIALNCTTNLSWFDHIVPCGIEGADVISLAKLLDKDEVKDEAFVGVKRAEDALIDQFQQSFNCQTELVSDAVMVDILKDL